MGIPHRDLPINHLPSCPRRHIEDYQAWEAAPDPNFRSEGLLCPEWGGLMSYVEISPSLRNVTLQLDASMKYPTSARMSIFSAVHMRAMGLFPFPLANPRILGREKFKHPGMRLWQFHAEFSCADQLISWDREGRNLGLYLRPSGLVALDSDTEEAESWATKNLPETPWVTNTAKGRHRLYRLGRFAQTPIDNKPIPGMDRKHSGYIVAPGSRHFAVNWQVPSEGDWSVPLGNLPIY